MSWEVPRRKPAVQAWPQDRSPCGRLVLQCDRSRGEAPFWTLWVSAALVKETLAALAAAGVKEAKVRDPETGDPLRQGALWGAVSGTYRGNVNWSTGRRRAAVTAGELLLRNWPGEKTDGT